MSLWFWLAVPPAALLLLWWLADHRRGILWAQRAIRRYFPEVPALTPAELAARLADAEQQPPVLLDARSLEEQAVSMLPAAHAVDPESKAEDVLQRFPPDRDLVVYCAAGYRAARLARRLIAAGRRRVFNLDGGIFAWANAGLPLEKDGQPAAHVHAVHPVFSRLLKNRNPAD